MPKVSSPSSRRRRFDGTCCVPSWRVWPTFRVLWRKPTGWPPPAHSFRLPSSTKNSNQVAGSTRYLDILPNDRAIEIGSTCLGHEFQRTAINSECKYRLLRYAFEDLAAGRVTVKTALVQN